MNRPFSLNHPAFPPVHTVHATFTAHGVLDTNDAADMQRFLLGKGTLADRHAADINNDGILSTADLLAIKRMLV